ncbi:MAG: hypothetical protein LBK99_19595 [Opitutaceae bacterium]|jgi:hypothetical protein|nr:hypothetical protein [Opitutaceae bacterium]
MIHNKIPDQHLFTVRNRPVLFLKGERYFGALHAVERGYFPVSSTGYHSLAAFSPGVRNDTRFHDLLSRNFLDSIAAEQDRQTNKALHDIVCCASRDMSDESICFSILHRAAHAFEYGFFATIHCAANSGRPRMRLTQTCSTARLSDPPKRNPPRDCCEPLMPTAERLTPCAAA